MSVLPLCIEPPFLYNLLSGFSFIDAYLLYFLKTKTNMPIKRATRAVPVAIRPPARGETLEEDGLVSAIVCIVVLAVKRVRTKRVDPCVTKSVLIFVSVLLS